MNVTDGLWAQAETTPDAPAILTKAGGLSFAELQRAVSWTAAGFAKAGLAPGDIVALQLPQQTQHLITALALARMGVGQLAFDTTDPPRLQEDQTRRLGIAATISTQPKDAAPNTSHLAPPPANIRDLQALHEGVAPVAQDPDLPFMILRSSGTTSGIVKLSILTHALCRRRFPSHRVELPQGPGHRYLSLVDLNFVSTKQRFFAGLDAGTCVVPFDGLEGMDDCLEFILDKQIDYISGTPLHAGRLLEHAGDDGLLLPKVAALRLGTTVIPNALRKRIRARLTPKLFVGYGCNEIGPIATATPDQTGRIPGAVGLPVKGVETKLLDQEGQPLGAGDNRGRLLLRSPGMITHYHEAPEDDARAFRDGWFDTGDLVELSADGVVVHHGRADDVMIFDGINIYPAEIEQALLQHPGVAEATAFPVSTNLRGGIPFAAVVVAAEAEAGGPTTAELVTHCKARLGQRGPQGVLILPAFPRNAVGKVLKRELSEKARRLLK